MMGNPVFAAAAAVAAIGLAGCSQQTVQQAGQDAQRDVATVDQKAQQAAQKLKPATQELDLGARVTTALQVNPNLPHTIRVDASTSGVRLRGTVETPQQKKLADQIAKATVPAGKSVSNELTVDKT